MRRRLIASTTASRIGALAAAAATAAAFAPESRGSWDARRSSCDGAAAAAAPKLSSSPSLKPTSSYWSSWFEQPPPRSSSLWPLSSSSSSSSGPTAADDAPSSSSTKTKTTTTEPPWRRLLGEDFEPVRWANRYEDPQHAINGTLNGATMVEAYELYRPAATPADAEAAESPDRPVLVARVGFGTHLNGHGGIVHGGILGLMFDDAIGCGSYEALLSSSLPSAASRTLVTANLSVDYRRPVPEGTNVLLEVFLERWEGRKFYLRARMIDADDRGEDTGEEILYAEATSLYIMLREDEKK